jgi:hypothetical protein
MTLKVILGGERNAYSKGEWGQLSI